MSDAQAEEARRLWEQEDYTLQQIRARLELRCSLKTIHNAATGRTYKKTT